MRTNNNQGPSFNAYDIPSSSTKEPGSGPSTSSGGVDFDSLPWPESIRDLVSQSPALESAYEALSPEDQQELAQLVSMFSTIVGSGSTYTKDEFEGKSAQGKSSFTPMPEPGDPAPSLGSGGGAAADEDCASPPSVGSEGGAPPPSVGSEGGPSSPSVGSEGGASSPSAASGEDCASSPSVGSGAGASSPSTGSDGSLSSPSTGSDGGLSSPSAGSDASLSSPSSVSGASGGASAGGGGSMEAMNAAQQKYVADQALVAAGKLDPSALAQDWQAYLQAAQAWQLASLPGGTGGASGTPSTPSSGGLGGSTPSDLGTASSPSEATEGAPSTDSAPPKSSSTPGLDDAVDLGAESSPSTGTGGGSYTPSGGSTPSTESGGGDTGAPSGGSVGSTPSVATGGKKGSGGVMGILGGDSNLPKGALGPYEPYREAIVAASKATGVSATILAAMLVTEARGCYGGAGKPLLDNPLQVSTNAGGDMAQNVLEGAKQIISHSEEALAKYGKADLGVFLRAYNSGPNGVDPGNLHALPAGLGQPYYVDQVTSNIKSIEAGNGSALPT
jgi:hypothetical protein